MKKHLCLFVPALALMVMGCGGAGNNDNQNENNPSQVVENVNVDLDGPLFDVDDDVDWERPLYTLDDNGDTTEIWQYNQRGQLVYYESKDEDFEDTRSYIYDASGRLLRQAGYSFTGNVREFTEEYTYNGKVRTAMGIHTTEGYPSYYKTKEVSYFMDEDFKYDTLRQQYEIELSWDIEDYDEKEIEEGLSHLARYSTYKYTVINGETKLAEECYYYEDIDNPSTLNLGYRSVNHYNSQGLLVSNVSYSSSGGEFLTEYSYSGNVKDGKTYYARKSQFTTWQYVEPKENIVQKAAEQLLPEEYIGGLACQSKTMATVPIGDGETQTIACYQRSDGSWLVLEYWPTQGPENDKLSVYVLGKDGKLEPSDAQNLPLNLEGMRVLGNELFFPYQGDELQFGKDCFVFPMEDGEPLRLEWNGEQFVVVK